MSQFEVKLSDNQNERSGCISLKFINKVGKEIRVNITSLLIKREGEDSFREEDNFKILVSGMVDRDFRIDLDPYERRSYGVWFDCIISYDFQLIAKDKEDNEFVLKGSRDGISLKNMPQPNEQVVSTPVLNMNVRVKPCPGFSLAGRFVVTPEDGTPNEFGIFNHNELNPTAAYIDLGRDGYKTLTGKFFVELDWDRDTVASPPDDLWAVHIKSVDSNAHGWFFRTDLLFQLDDTTAI